MGFLNLDPETILLQIIAFVLLVWILRRFGWQRVAAIVSALEEEIRGALEGAARERKEAEQFRTSLMERLAHIEEEHRDRVQQAVREANEASQRILHDAQAEREALIGRAKSDIEYAKQQALIELRDYMADLTTTVAAKALRRTLDEDMQRRFLDETIRELEATVAPQRNGGSHGR